jgi:hypothetical protein
MNNNNDVIGELVNIAIAVIKDEAIRKNIYSVENAYRELLIQEASLCRKRNTSIILSIHKIDIELIKLETTLSNVENELSNEAIEPVNKIISYMKKHRNRLVMEKNKCF